MTNINNHLQCNSPGIMKRTRIAATKTHTKLASDILIESGCHPVEEFTMVHYFGGCNNLVELP